MPAVFCAGSGARLWYRRMPHGPLMPRQYGSGAFRIAKRGTAGGEMRLMRRAGRGYRRPSITSIIEDI